MLQRSCFTPLAISAFLALAGCAGSEPVPQDQQTAEVPELNLNLPAAQQECQQVPMRDFTFLERGYQALAAGDYIEAVQYFQRFQRLEKSPVADWEADIAIAYISMLPRSPFYDPEAARASFAELHAVPESGQMVHTQALMMRDGLETLVAQQRHIDDLENNNAILREDLQKREDALKSLREITLGQRGAAQ